jgi:hypothetical protein
VEIFPQSLAFAAGAVVSQLVSNNDVLDASTSHYQLSTLGLGTGQSEKFAALLEPYWFATGIFSIQ